MAQAAKLFINIPHPPHDIHGRPVIAEYTQEADIAPRIIVLIVFYIESQKNILRAFTIHNIILKLVESGNILLHDIPFYHLPVQSFPGTPGAEFTVPVF